MNYCICNNGDWDGWVKLTDGEYIKATRCPCCGNRLRWYEDEHSREEVFKIIATTEVINGYQNN